MQSTLSPGTPRSPKHQKTNIAFEKEIKHTAIATAKYKITKAEWMKKNETWLRASARNMKPILAAVGGEALGCGTLLLSDNEVSCVWVD